MEKTIEQRLSGVSDSVKEQAAKEIERWVEVATDELWQQRHGERADGPSRENS